MAWDLDKEQLVNTIPLASDSSISALVGIYRQFVLWQNVYETTELI